MDGDIHNADESEEEILVHVEFDCEVDPGMFSPEHTFKIIGIDSELPLMQVGDKVFQGEWRDIVGTSVFFEEDEEKKTEMAHSDPLFSKVLTRPLKLACHTRKSLLMSRVFVKPKNNPQDDVEKQPNSTLSDEGHTEAHTNNCNSTEENDEQMEVT